MKKFFKVLINTVLVLVLVCALGWYFAGDDIFKALGSNMETEANEVAATEDVVVEEDPVPKVEAVEQPVNTTTNIVFTGDVEISEYVQAAYDARGIDGVASADVQSLLRDATFTMINNEFCFSERGQKAPDKQYTFISDGFEKNW